MYIDILKIDMERGFHTWEKKLILIFMPVPVFSSILHTITLYSRFFPEEKMFPYNSITMPRKRQPELLSIQQQKRQNTLKTKPMPSISQHDPSLTKITKIVNARLLLNHQIVSNTYLWLQNGRIIHPQDLFFSQHRDADEIIDAEGLLVVPGFIDIQINGAFGIDLTIDIEDVPNVTDEELKSKVDKVAKGLLKFGCTSFCPTVISSEQEVYHRVSSIYYFCLREAAESKLPSFTVTKRTAVYF